MYSLVVFGEEGYLKRILAKSDKKGALFKLHAKFACDIGSIV